MREPRFQVRSITGYGAGGRTPSTSYCVVDRDYCFREVASFYAPERGNQRRAQRLRSAERVCAELNASVALEDARIHTSFKDSPSPST